MNINEFRITYALPTYLCKVKCRNNIDQSYGYVDNFWEKWYCLILILVKKAEKRKVNDEPTDSFYFIKGMPDGLFPWKNGKPEVSIF
jgi:hypothetical protein